MFLQELVELGNEVYRLSDSKFCGSHGKYCRFASWFLKQIEQKKKDSVGRVARSNRGDATLVQIGYDGKMCSA